MGGLLQTLRQTYRTMISRPVLFMWLAGWLIAAVAGPFGTYETMTLLPRALYWITISSVSILLGYLGFGVAIWLVGQDNHPRQAWVGALVSTSLVGPAVWGVTLLSEKLGTGAAPGFWTMVFYAALLCTTVAVLRLLLQEVLFQEQAPPPHLDVEAALLRRLPDDMRGRILRLSAADHVVRVVTDKGETDLRMRFSDAVNEMDGVEGYCTHRSHWVAVVAVTGARREAGRWVIELCNGDAVPVSRKYQPELEVAGLLNNLS